MGFCTLWTVNLYFILEIKFWGEVLIEFFEIDGTSSDKMLDEHRKEVKDHIEMLQQAEDEINEARKARGLDPLPS